MSDYLSDFVTALQVKIGTVWTDILPANGGGGTFDAEHITEVPWAQLIAPYAVTIVSDLQKAPGCPLSGLYYHASIQIYRVQAIEGPRTPLRSKLVTLQQALWPNVFLAGGRIIDIPNVAWHQKLAPNEFFASKGVPYRAGMVQTLCWVGYTP